MGYVRGRRQQPSDPQHMGTAVRTARTSPASRDAFADVDAFVDEVLMELAAMEADGTKPTRSGPKPALAGAALRKAIMAIWCLCFCGMGLSSDWGCGGRQGMTGRVFDRLGIRNGVDFAPGGNRDQWVEPKR